LGYFLVGHDAKQTVGAVPSLNLVLGHVKHSVVKAPWQVKQLKLHCLHFLSESSPNLPSTHDPQVKVVVSKYNPPLQTQFGDAKT